MTKFYGAKVHIPKGVKIVNRSAKMTPAQNKFAKGEVRFVKKFISTK